MTELHNLTIGQLKTLLSITQQIEGLKAQLDAVVDGNPPAPANPPKRKMSKAARTAIASAQRARWAKVKKQGKNRL
ncbi:MAG TPA: hypothetical protein VGO67_14900 [Verrucomicrobiae bacterium]|jgi:hypothetical protein